MSDVDPYTAPKADLMQAPPDTTATCSGCSLVTGLGGLLGLILGGAYGIREFNAAVDRAVREEGFADFLPVGVLLWAIIGAVIGAMAARLLLGAWRLVAYGQREPE